MNQNCIKCGGERISLHYLPGPDLVKCTCISCAYTWRTLPLDSPPDRVIAVPSETKERKYDAEAHSARYP